MPNAGAIATTILTVALLLLPSRTFGTDLSSCLYMPANAVDSSGFGGCTLPLGPLLQPDGFVPFPDSTQFGAGPLSNCQFFKWAEQMFLWVTAPTPSAYGGGPRVFESNVFYDVSSLDSNGERTLSRHPPGGIGDLRLRSAQLGGHGFPLIMASGTNHGFTKRGRWLEVAPSPTGPHGLPVVLAKHAEVEVSAVVLNRNGRKARYLDQAGAIIRGAKPIFRKEWRHALIVQQFVLVGGTPVFVSRSSNVINTQVGQAADSFVLQTQDSAYPPGTGGSLVYYGVHVNDVFAYFLTGKKNGFLSTTSPLPISTDDRFPTSANDATAIINYALDNDPNPSAVSLADLNVMTVELKTSWVRAQDLANRDSYVQTTATVPKYAPDPNDPTGHWIPDGDETIPLALVGMHVVGSTQLHPEMIWATFEHVCNTPNVEYEYVSSNPSTGFDIVGPPDNTLGTWLFAASGSTGPFNRAHMRYQDSDNSIKAMPGFTISPSDTIRVHPWGSQHDDASTAPGRRSLNGTIIEFNNQIRNQLPANDVRRNYNVVGVSWLNGGVGTSAPLPDIVNGAIAPVVNGHVAQGFVLGTPMVANSTMETYFQGDVTQLSNTGGAHCFMCHNVNDNSGAGLLSSGLNMSHIYEQIVPLF